MIKNHFYSKIKASYFLITFALTFIYCSSFAQKNKNTAIIAYYTGNESLIENYPIEKLTHIIYSFAHLKNGELTLSSKKDTLTLKRLVDYKKQYPNLKIMLSLGGWSGCEPCSETFASESLRIKFANSVKTINDYFKCDGLDLDWEYPTIEGYPGHLYQQADKKNFTALVQILRTTLGKKMELSFAAGGFKNYLDNAVEWNKVIPLVDRVNVMSYDLVNGYSKITGHHTPLFSTNNKEESTDKAVQYLLNLGISPKKIVIGAAFYTRVWKNVSDKNNGLYQSGEPTNGIDYKNYTTEFTKVNGWNYFWDKKAKAPYWYNFSEKKFATGDDLKSVKEKSNYVLQKKLGGIMFWELVLDTQKNGLVDVMYNTIKK